MWDYQYDFQDGKLKGFDVYQTENGRYTSKEAAYSAANEAIGEF